LGTTLLLEYVVVFARESVGMAICAGAMFQAPRRFGIRTFSSHNWVNIFGA